jgi:hypothetical protein
MREVCLAADLDWVSCPRADRVNWPACELVGGNFGLG